MGHRIGYRILPLNSCNIGCLFYSQLVLQNFTTAQKNGNILLTYGEAFFLRHSSEYETLESDLKINRNTYPDAVSCDRICLNGPKSGKLGPNNQLGPTNM